MTMTSVLDPVVAAPDEQRAFVALDDVFQVKQPKVPKLLGPNGEEIELPSHFSNY